jgi:hypothetical protein
MQLLEGVVLWGAPAHIIQITNSVYVQDIDERGNEKNVLQKAEEDVSWIHKH